MFIDPLNFIYLSCITLFFLILSWASIRENEIRALLLSVLFLLLNAILWLLFILWKDVELIRAVNIGVLIIISTYIFISSLKWFPRQDPEDLDNLVLFDERDHMFSRNNLQFHPELRDHYYKDNPEKKEVDQNIHALPELGQNGGTFYHDLYSPLTGATDSITVSTLGASGSKVNPEKTKLDPSQISDILSHVAHYNGAQDIGITELRNYHFYSHAGRQHENWGEPIDNNHRYAIVIIVAMKIDMIKTAPAIPVMLESTRCYLETAKIAHILANYIKSLGYDARAHFDGRYQLACVPVAHDAGLGEIGRIGILMHPKYGPCLRLAVVTTDLDLQETSSKSYHMESFCEICKKCATNCPTGSITQNNKPTNRGFKHWFINMESCYKFWKRVGSDCAICIRVCPYTKSDTFIHQLVRFYISRNRMNQRIALWMDDLFYSRKIKVAVKNPDQGQLINLIKSSEL